MKGNEAPYSHKLNAGFKIQDLMIQSRKRKPLAYLDAQIIQMPCSAAYDLGPVVQSVVSLTSSLKVISLTVLADSIYNILIFFAEKM